MVAMGHRLACSAHWQWRARLAGASIIGVIPGAGLQRLLVVGSKAEIWLLLAATRLSLQQRHPRLGPTHAHALLELCDELLICGRRRSRQWEVCMQSCVMEAAAGWHIAGIHAGPGGLKHGRSRQQGCMLGRSLSAGAHGHMLSATHSQAGLTCCADEPLPADGLVQAPRLGHAAHHLLGAGQGGGGLRLVPAHRLAGQVERGQGPDRRRHDVGQGPLGSRNHLPMQRAELWRTLTPGWPAGDDVCQILSGSGKQVLLLCMG